jgi:hypothetical protein
MDSDAGWLTAEAFAPIADISPQAARRALRRGFAGEAWRGHALLVRERLGRARAGYEVLRDSLPAGLRPSGSAENLPHRPRAGAPNVTAARWAVLQKALAHAPRSVERAEAIAAAALASGRTARTLYRWIDQVDRHGVQGLARAKPSNAGRPRVIVSRVFDRACRAASHDEAVVKAIAQDVHKALKGLWASRAEHAGGREIRRLAEFILLEACEARDLKVPRSAMRLSRRTVERFAHYRVVNQRRNDRKAFDDAKPRIRRDWTMLAPMERIVGDVKHLDVIVEREDGTPAWPKIVAFMDAGTGRVFVVPFLLERGEGVRQEHVIEAFLAMACDPHWGFPQGLYLDNGSEFTALTKLASTLALVNEPAARTLIYAKPYNASAKPIESLFARLDRYVFSLLPGYAGPNRMAKKTQTLGKPPKPYPGTWGSFCETVTGLIAAHNDRPVGGLWKDRSPNAWLQGKADAGWRPAHVDPQVLDATFCDQDSRRVDRGVVRIAGERYTHPELQALPTRTVVDLALPWRRGASPLCRTRAGAWVYLERELPFPARWIKGARETSRRQQRQGDYVRQLAREAPVLDPVAIKIRAARAVEPAPAAPRRVDTIDLGTELRAMAVAHRSRAEPPATPPVAELRRAREMALTERLERKQKGGT